MNANSPDAPNDDREPRWFSVSVEFFSIKGRDHDEVNEVLNRLAHMADVEIDGTVEVEPIE